MKAAGRSALVSGGQGGIGRATVAALAAADHNVAVADLDGSTAPPGAAEAIGCDLSDPAACVSAVEVAKTVAREVGRFGIRSNVVAPGMVRTPMTDALPEEVKQQARDDSCLGRLAEPKDIASVIAFLASPQAGHITGQVIRVDGGQYL